jgi:hypothetical protein
VNSGIATIQVTYQVLSPIDSYVEMQIVQRLMDGEAQFDIEKGQLIAQQMDVDKRVIGFAGPTSSMQYIMRMEEKLLKDDPKMAAKPKSGAVATDKSKSGAVAKNGSTNSESSSTTAKDTKSSNSKSSSKTQTASRPRTTQPGSRTRRR